MSWRPLTAGAMQRFLATHNTLDDLPMAVSLRAFYHVTISGEPGTVRGTARAVTASLASLHSPEDLAIAVFAARESAPEWEWAKWLPHVQAPGVADGAGSLRLISTDPVELEDRLASRLEGRPRFHPGGPPVPEQPHLVVVLDGVSLPPTSLLASPEGLQGVTVLEVVPGDLSTGRGDLSVIVQPRELRLESAHGMVYEGDAGRPVVRGGGGARPSAGAAAHGVGRRRRRTAARQPGVHGPAEPGRRRLGRPGSGHGGPARSRSGCGCRSVSARTAGP